MCDSHSQISGIVLAGGQGRRMQGEDKGLITINGKRMIGYVLASLARQTGRLFISANRNMEAYQQFNYPVISDEHQDFRGPLAGIASVMGLIDTPYLLVTPCDAPLLADDLASRLLNEVERAQADIAVAHDGERIQPVFCLLKRGLHGSLNRFLAQGRRKIDGWFAGEHMVTVDCRDQREMFTNINTPEERMAVEKILRDRALHALGGRGEGLEHGQ